MHGTELQKQSWFPLRGFGEPQCDSELRQNDRECLGYCALFRSRTARETEKLESPEVNRIGQPGMCLKELHL